MDVWELNQELARFGWKPLRHLGGITSDESLHNRVKAGRAPFSLHLTFTLQLRKSTENLSQGNRAALGTARYVDLAAL
jgi:hypothetical protein